MAWSQADNYNYFVTYFLPLMWVSMFVNCFAVVTFYAFKKQRVFPASILAWLCALEFIYSLHMVIKWSPYSIAHDVEVRKLKAPSVACNFLVGLEIGMLSGLIFIHDLIAITLFVSVVLNKPMETKITYNYFIAFIASFWIWTSVEGITTGVGQQSTAPSYCQPTEVYYYLVRVVPFCVSLIFQIICLVPAMKEIRKILTAANNLDPAKKRERRAALLYIRYFSAFLNQIMGLTPGVFFTLATQKPGGADPNHFKAIAMERMGAEKNTPSSEHCHNCKLK